MQWAETPAELLDGMDALGYQQENIDGQRHVDYVLTYHVKRPGTARHARHTSRLLTDNPLARSLRRGPLGGAARPAGQQEERPRGGHPAERAATAGATVPPAPRPTSADAERGLQTPSLDEQEDDKRCRREEFEKNLLDMGLELERDEDGKTQGVGFLKIHAPWNILCREAEFMKLKMPTKKMYAMKQSSSVVEKINSLISKVLEPLRPSVEEHKPKNIKHLSYTFSREKQHLGVYTAAYPLHDGDVSGEHAEPNDRKLLYEEWASYSVFYKYQPIGLVRKYFGEKIGLYFAWLGLYTQMLIPASVVGVIVFLYGCATVDDNIPSMEICHPRYNITMCPLCDKACSYWRLSTASAMFMEHWKRRQMRLNYEWDLTGFEEEEDHPRAEYELQVMQKSSRKERGSQKKTGEEKLTCRDRLPAYMTNLVMMLLMIGVTFAIVFGVILYRISTKAALHMSSNPITRSHVRLTVKTTAAIINLVVILILDEVYGAVARWLTVLEVPKTDKSFEQRLIFKTFILKFVNAFTPIIYIASSGGRWDPFGFVTLFVASFPLAPLFALLNNIIEIRLDAKKFVGELQRPVAARAKDIGGWRTVRHACLNTASAFSERPSSSLHVRTSSRGWSTSTCTAPTLHARLRQPHASSYFNVSHFQDGKEPMDPLHLGYAVDICRYKDYREPPWSTTPYEISKEFWAVLAARLAFVIVFQNVVMLMSDVVDWLIPDIPKDISTQIHKEKILMVELFMREEQGKMLHCVTAEGVASAGGDKQEKRNSYPVPLPRQRSAPPATRCNNANNANNV
ncbi:hypothetical protein CRUP_008230 [Coryphaenoides rupestris]|nr:hypothetical protein CRUP_008230 [Coryphaenoides rupestris]